MKVRDEKDKGYWIDEFRNGKHHALNYFFKLHYKSLCYFARRLTQNDLEFEDIVADCFVKIWERHENFRTEENIKAFLYITCRNACLNYLQQVKNKSAAQLKYLGQLEQAEETILLQIIESEVTAIINDEIEQLPDNYREVFKLIYFNNLKTDEIAKILDLNVQTVRNYKSRAILLLKTSLLTKKISPALILALLFFLDRN